MPPARIECLEPERRRRLLAAAAREFAAEGYEGASLDWIAEEAGFSKPALNHDFGDKPILYATVVRESWQRLSPEGHGDLAPLDRSTWRGGPADGRTLAVDVPPSRG